MPNVLALQKQGDISFLSDLSAKDKPWDEHKSESQTVIQAYSRTDFKAYAARIADCSNRLEFALTEAVESGENKLRLAGAYFCRVRFCPTCQWRRSLKWRSRTFEALPRILAAYPTHRFVFLTLTVRNCPLEELRSQIDHINQAFKKLSRYKQFPGIGWIKGVEVTRGKNGSAHPHIHCLLMVTGNYFSRNYLSSLKWAEMWQRVAQLDYFPSVNIKAVKPNSKRGLVEQICHVLKYQVKPVDLVSDPQWLQELTYQLHRSRAIAIGGVFKKFLKPIDDDEDLIHIKEDDQEDDEIELEDAHLFFLWHYKFKRYYLTNPIT